MVILGVRGLFASFAWSDEACCALAADESNTPNRASDTPYRMRHDLAIVASRSIGPRANARRACPQGQAYGQRPIEACIDPVATVDVATYRSDCHAKAIQGDHQPRHP